MAPNIHGTQLDSGIPRQITSLKSDMEGKKSGLFKKRRREGER